MSRLASFKTRLLRSNSRLVGSAAFSAGRWLADSPIGLAGKGRLIVDSLQPVDPLRKEKHLPPLEVVIPFVLKDMETLRPSIEGAIASSRNPVARVTLITPQRSFLEFPNLGEQLEILFSQFPDGGVLFELLIDEEFLPQNVISYLQRENLKPRDRGWVTQQFAKLSAVLNSDFAGTLVVDADTVLMYQRTWLSQDGRQILMFGQESRDPFFSFANQFHGFTGRPRFSFVTHHQLMQRSVLSEIFGSADGLLDLLEFASNKSLSDNPLRAISEYEIYGAYLSEARKEFVVPATWGNGSGNRMLLGRSEGGDASWALSVSYHHYLSRSGTPDNLL